MITISISDLRKQLKSAGFNVKVESLSFGKSGTVFRLSDKEQMPSIFFSEENRQTWISAIDIISDIRVVDKHDQSISGSWS